MGLNSNHNQQDVISSNRINQNPTATQKKTADHCKPESLHANGNPRTIQPQFIPTVTRGLKEILSDGHCRGGKASSPGKAEYTQVKMFNLFSLLYGAKVLHESHTPISFLKNIQFWALGKHWCLFHWFMFKTY